MIRGIIGKKLGMTRIYDKNGNVVPVTLIEAGPCTVTGVRTTENDGYNAVQLGFDPLPEKKVNDPMKGFFKEKGVSPVRILREFRSEDALDCKVGDQVTVDIFKDIVKVKVIGLSKGAGFQGGMKRHGFSGAKMTHGQSKVHRKPMSAGSTDAARVFKGKRSPGHMGDARITVRNLSVVIVDAERNVLAVRGAVPGKTNGIVMVKA